MPTLPQHWLMKTEPDTFSLSDLQARPGRVEPWNGVRNYQARNFICSMRPGDLVLFYHSSCPEPGVAGLAEVIAAPRPDPTQFDPNSEFFDASAKADKPRWWLVDVRYVATFPKFVSLVTLRAQASLHKMRLLAPGNRLSVTPVTSVEYQAICHLGGLNPAKIKSISK